MTTSASRTSRRRSPVRLTEVRRRPRAARPRPGLGEVDLPGAHVTQQDAVGRGPGQVGVGDLAHAGHARAGSGRPASGCGRPTHPGHRPLASSGARPSDRPAGPARAAAPRTTPAQRTQRAEPARFAAYTLLRAVADGAYANLEMPRIIRQRRLEPRDAAFATELAFGTVRWQGLYDAVIAVAADRPVERIDPEVLDVLRLGVHQLLGMRVPAHAAADQTVGLARTVVGQGASGLVNAVLRRVGGRTLEEWTEAVTPEGEGSRRSPCATRTPSGSSPRCGPRCSATAGRPPRPSTPSSPRCSPPTTSRRGSTSWPVPVSRRSRSCRRRRRRAERDLPVGVVLQGGDPGASPPSARAARRCRTRGRSRGPRPRRRGGPRAGCRTGGSTSAPARAARPVSSAGSPPRGANLTAVEVSPHRADLVRSELAAVIERPRPQADPSRSGPPTAARSVRRSQARTQGPRRCTLHGPRGPAASTRGPVAPAAR